MKVRFFCGMAIGPIRWQTPDIYEPDECSMEGVIVVRKRDFKYGHVQHECPFCKNTLYQSDGHFYEIKDEDLSGRRTTDS